MLLGVLFLLLSVRAKLTNNINNPPFATEPTTAATMEDALLLRHQQPIQLAATAPDKLLLVRGRGTADAPRPNPRRRRPSSDRFSSHSCIGDMSTVKPRAHRACLFENICLDTSAAEFNYYRDESITQPPILQDQRYGHLFSFGHVAPKGGREDMLPLNKHVRYKRHVRWSPRLVDGPMPANAPLLPALHLLSAPFVPTNLGHLAWEEAFPLILAMAQLGAYAPEAETVVLRTHGCNETVGARDDSSGRPKVEPVSRGEAKLCQKFVDGFLRPVGVVQTIALLARQHASRGHKHVCFKRLGAGGFYDMFNQPAHPGKEPWLQLYRHRVLAHHSLAPMHSWPPPPTSHKLLIVRKEGRRGIHNMEEVLAYTKGGCGGLCTGIREVVDVSFQTLTIREQLQLVSSATIALSPPGACVLPLLLCNAMCLLFAHERAARCAILFALCRRCFDDPPLPSRGCARDTHQLHARRQRREKVQPPQRRGGHV